MVIVDLVACVAFLCDLPVFSGRGAYYDRVAVTNRLLNLAGQRDRVRFLAGELRDLVYFVKKHVPAWPRGQGGWRICSGQRQDHAWKEHGEGGVVVFVDRFACFELWRRLDHGLNTGAGCELGKLKRWHHKQAGSGVLVDGVTQAVVECFGPPELRTLAKHDALYEIIRERVHDSPQIRSTSVEPWTRFRTGFGDEDAMLLGPLRYAEVFRWTPSGSDFVGNVRLAH